MEVSDGRGRAHLGSSHASSRPALATPTPPYPHTPTHPYFHTSTPSRAGFTLVELLVALVILSTLMGALSLAFRTGLDASERVHQQADAAQEAEIVLNTLRDDIEQATLDPTSTDRSWFIGTDETDGTTDHDTLRFITHSPGVPLRDIDPSVDWESQPHHADWGAVTYSLSPAGTDEDSGLYRREQIPPGVDPFEETGNDEQLSSEVIGLNFRYFDGTDWQDAWDTTGDNAGVMPQAVEVTLTFRPAGPNADPRSLTATFPIRTPQPAAGNTITATGTGTPAGAAAGGGAPAPTSPAGGGAGTGGRP